MDKVAEMSIIEFVRLNEASLFFIEYWWIWGITFFGLAAVVVYVGNNSSVLIARGFSDALTQKISKYSYACAIVFLVPFIISITLRW